MGTGSLWAVDAYDCDPAALRSVECLGGLFRRLVSGAGLRTVAEPVWHVFPGAGGVTGVVLLSESHLACHTYPEHRLATIDLHCCRRGAAWDWDAILREQLGARRVTVSCVARGADVAAAGVRQ